MNRQKDKKAQCRWHWATRQQRKPDAAGIRQIVLTVWFWTNLELSVLLLALLLHNTDIPKFLHGCLHSRTLDHAYSDSMQKLSHKK
jgi:hypothetical protein